MLCANACGTFWWNFSLSFCFFILPYSLPSCFAFRHATGGEAVRCLARAYGAVMSSLQFLCAWLLPGCQYNYTFFMFSYICVSFLYFLSFFNKQLLTTTRKEAVRNGRKSFADIEVPPWWDNNMTTTTSTFVKINARLWRVFSRGPFKCRKFSVSRNAAEQHKSLSVLPIFYVLTLVLLVPLIKQTYQGPLPYEELRRKNLRVSPQAVIGSSEQVQHVYVPRFLCLD